MSQTGTSRAAGSARAPRPPSQSPFSVRTSPDRRLVELGEPLGLRDDVAVRPRRIQRDRSSRPPRRGRRRRARPGPRASPRSAASGMAGGSTRTSVAGTRPAAGIAAAVIAPQLCPTIRRSGRSSPAAAAKARDPRRCRRTGGGPANAPSRRGPAGPARRPGTRRQRAPVPTRHHVRAVDVTPWRSSTGGASAAPQAMTWNGMPAASTVDSRWRRREPASAAGDIGRGEHRLDRVSSGTGDRGSWQARSRNVP